jgi:prevent-host-death family protein
VKVNVHEAKSQLSRLIEAAERGEEVVIARAGQPAVRLVPIVAHDDSPRQPGAWRGRVRIADDFDELPADIADAFGA